jgi:AAA+ ATPase superfamily predicted ATPase
MSKVLPVSGTHMLVMYGRRRVGKTELLKHYYADRPHVYFMGAQSASALHVRGLSERIGQLWNDRYLLQSAPSEWEGLLGYLSQQSRPLDLILDEFPYLCEADPSLPSLLQRFWDEHARERELRLTLCGSSVSFMEDRVLSERSPLFGRRTAQMLLRPMTLWDIGEFLPSYSRSQLVEAYACVGGIPAYLAKLGPSQTIRENVREQILDPWSYLYEEPRLLLQQELREPRIYFSVLSAIAGGRTRLNEIAQDCQMPGATVGRYLDQLIRLHLVERRVPVTERLHNSRKGLYRIQDPFLRFWFRFVQANLSELEYSRSDEVYATKIAPEMNHFVAPVFEEVCRQWLGRNPHILPFRPERVGAWWDREHEVDVVAYDGENVLFGECKWSENPVTGAALQQLVRNSAAVPGFQGHRKLYGLFSKSGFSQALDGCLTFTLDQILE